MATQYTCDVCGKAASFNSYVIERKVITRGARDVCVRIVVGGTDPSSRLDVCDDCGMDAAYALLKEVDMRPRKV
jgi:hypothetical protein